MCEWYERAQHNGVLGTQKGTQLGAYLYMLPLGGGVSKSGGSKRWSNPASPFLCCMGSGIEAFGRRHPRQLTLIHRNQPQLAAIEAFGRRCPPPHASRRPLGSRRFCLVHGPSALGC